MFLWPEEFRRTQSPNSTVRDLSFLVAQAPFSEDMDVSTYKEWLWVSVAELGDNKWWRLTGNSTFSVKSFYNFLNDGGLRCPNMRFFWQNSCLKKINIFNWLSWKNKILTLENLESRKCNRFPIATCVLCHSAIESVDHLFLQCSFARQVWDYFVRLLHLPDLPMPLHSVWVTGDRQ